MQPCQVLIRGTLLWQQNLEGTATNNAHAANSVAVDNLGNVVAGAAPKNTGTFLDLTAARK